MALVCLDMWPRTVFMAVPDRSGLREVAKLAANTSRKRVTRFRACQWCNDPLPLCARSHAKYCCDRCRHYARIDRGNTGRVYRVHKLKCGKVSIVIHVDKARLTAGDQIKWGKVS